MRRLIFPLILLLAIVCADQITKIWVLDSLSPGQTLSVIGQFFQLRLAYNEGGAMGTVFGPGTFYLITSCLVLLVVLYLLYVNRNNAIVAFSLAAVAGGAIGNIIDRIRIGWVIDFLDFDFFDINILGYKMERWWTFNVADSAITVGIIVLLAYILFVPRPKKPAAPDPAVPHEIS
jgi:signal peptidase II